MEAIITCIKQIGEGRRYYGTALDGDMVRVLEVRSAAPLELGACVEVQEGKPAAPADAAHADAILKHARRAAERAVLPDVYVSGVEEADTVIRKMWPELVRAAALLLRKIMMGAPIIVRFHNDADGSSGAYALYKSLEAFGEGGAFSGRCNIRWIMNKGVVYDTGDAVRDTLGISEYASLEKPLLLIMDFGTSVGSNGGIKHLDDKFDVIWLDHHPLEEGFLGKGLPFYINPWLFGGDSNITAGFLVSVFSKTLARIDTREIENASFIGDYSAYADRSKPGWDLALFLDMVTSDVTIATTAFSKNITPNEIDAVLSNKERYAELLKYAKVRLFESIDLALKNIKTYKAGSSTIYLSDFEELRSENTRYPLPGRFASKLLERIDEIGTGHAVLLLHFGSYISARVDDAISARVGILSIINDLKEKYPEEVESGGGHKNAASIKLAENSNKKQVIKALISIIKEHLADK